MVSFGLVPRVIESRTGEPAYNHAAHGAPPPVSYFLLRRALRSGVQPKAVVVDASYKVLAEGPGSQSRSYPWRSLLTCGEAADLFATARDPSLFGAYLACGALPSLDHRFEVRQIFRDLLGGRRPDYARSARAQTRNWDDNLGAQVLPKGQGFADESPREGSPPRAGTWKCDPVNGAYLRRFFALARGHNVPVFWLLPPVSRGTLAFDRWSGDERLYLEFVRDVRSQFPEVAVLDARDLIKDDSYFYDAIHLDQDGAVAFSTMVADAIRASDREGRGPGRSAPRVGRAFNEAPPAAKRAGLARGSSNPIRGSHLRPTTMGVASLETP